MENKNGINLIPVFAKLGLIGFGGGSALIPVIENEVVKKKKLLTKEQYDRNVVVASITPGALPVEISCGVGYETAGYWGMIQAAAGMTLPGAILVILFLLMYYYFNDVVLGYMKYPIAAVSAYIVCVLIKYICKVVMTHKGIDRLRSLLIIGCVFFFSCGKEINKLFMLDRKPLFDLSSIQLMGISFCFIFFLSGRKKLLRSIVMGIVCAIYILCVAKTPLITITGVKQAALIIMALLAVDGLIYSIKNMEPMEGNINWEVMVKTFGMWTLFLAAVSVPIVCMCGIDLPAQFESRGLLSSIISFGGGDAYLSVADGLFVEKGLISEEQFYEILIPIVNVLPGSILCKSLSGIGYMLGYGIDGSIVKGIFMGLAGFGVAVFGSCTVFMIVYQIYSDIEKIPVVAAVGKWIRPVISGVLLSIILTLLANVTKVFM